MSGPSLEEIKTVWKAQRPHLLYTLVQRQAVRTVWYEQRTLDTVMLDYTQPQTPMDGVYPVQFDLTFKERTRRIVTWRGETIEELISW